LRLLARRVQLVTVAPVTERRLVIRSQHGQRDLPNMPARPRDTAQGDHDMFDELLPHVEVLAASVLGACFAVVVIVSSALG
jgi:hypothetical protein